MRYWFFSETAYPDLPPESSYESVRVTLPNRLLDPERAATGGTSTWPNGRPRTNWDST